MSVTPDQIGAELSPPRQPSADEAAQWQTWIDDTLMLIELRAKSLNKTLADLDARVVDYVVRQAVSAHVRNPDTATQVSSTISIDDGSRTSSRSYRSSLGRVYIAEDLWRMLGLDAGGARAIFAVDTANPGGTNHRPWCALMFGALYCSCGASLTLDQPLWELGYEPW